jgi:hypothetical protein
VIKVRIRGTDLLKRALCTLRLPNIPSGSCFANQGTILGKLRQTRVQSRLDRPLTTSLRIGCIIDPTTALYEYAYGVANTYVLSITRR